MKRHMLEKSKKIWIFYLMMLTLLTLLSANQAEGAIDYFWEYPWTDNSTETSELLDWNTAGSPTVNGSHLILNQDNERVLQNFSGNGSSTNITCEVNANAPTGGNCDLQIPGAGGSSNLIRIGGPPAHFGPWVDITCKDVYTYGVANMTLDVYRTWYLTYSYDEHEWWLYWANETLIHVCTDAGDSYSQFALRVDAGNGCEVDYLNCWNGTIQDITLSVYILNETYNVTASDNGTKWQTNRSSVVITTDSTPTVTFVTDMYANCSIGLSDINYSTMIADDSDTKCSTTETTDMTCTLPSSKELNSSSEWLYISCISAVYGIEDQYSTSGPLAINYDEDEEVKAAITQGINNSLPSSSIHTDYQIYVRDKNDDQMIGTFDKAASWGSQFWAINYISAGESAIDMFNLTPAFYVLEMNDTTPISEISNVVSSFINDTKN